MADWDPGGQNHSLNYCYSGDAAAFEETELEGLRRIHHNHISIGSQR